MTVAQEWMELREIARLAEGATCGLQQLKKVKQAKWAVDEIRRLRAKVNRLIRVENSEDAEGNYVAQPNAQLEDLILEEEI